MKITNIPNELYLVALDLMGECRPEDPSRARDVLQSAESRVDYSTITAHQDGQEISPISAFGLAMAQYMSLSGPFSEDEGEFSGLNGYEVSN